MAPKTTFFILNRDDILPVVQTIIQDDGNYVDIAQICMIKLMKLHVSICF